ncbi:type II toxin-antitoxin system RelE/ParE family toxin [Marinospirillum sp.]|uniref:type II toxin-antitoxin system RelE/ParE family toxin n=1 Tax=Marinospirillum sp. TaxID=2183934 RepID=UPI003851385C
MIEWTSAALGDIGRLHRFLHEKNPVAAAEVVQRLTEAPEILLSNPRLGEKLFDFEPEEIRRLLVGQYEMRYQVNQGKITIIRIWHTREKR